jgi:hypothetical protein
MGRRPASWRWIAQSWRWIAQSRPTRSYAGFAWSFAEEVPIKPLGLDTTSGLSAASERRGIARMSSPRNSAPTPRNFASALIVLLPAALTDRESETTRSQQITRREPRIYWAFGQGGIFWLFRPPGALTLAPVRPCLFAPRSLCFARAISALTIRRRTRAVRRQRTLIAYDRIPPDDVPGRNSTSVIRQGPGVQTGPGHDGGGGNDLKRLLLDVA